MRQIYTQIFRLSLLTSAVLVFGSAGYVWVEDWSWFDGLYMTVITLATIGYGETHPLTHEGRLFTIVLILFGSGVLLYSVTSLAALVIEGELTHAIRRTKMTKAINRLSGHYIVCGYGSTGFYAVEELEKTGRHYVVVEADPAKIQSLRDRGILTIEGDATQDEALLQAGVARAAGLIATLHTDADNLFLVLTAKGLNKDMRIIAKAVDESSQQKLRSVGADGVVLPNFIGGLRMVSELVRPSVVTFLDMMLRAKDQSIRVEEIGIPHNSPHIGRSLDELNLLDVEGVSLVAVHRTGGSGYHFNPSPTMRIESGDMLIMMGESSRIAQLASNLSIG
ncbi:potassium channel family protein [Parachitinimonas caeni]|uniref:Potassium channel protein n=1 Tax=Parachitinimonas caeni TaxID=3031301 RepID=A0ABT7DX90_9NEIS|nr:potassium channel protein [Parachitinimonas caeni]MDK2124687.1 potassium channel protein [Parachitinimonas caeni]